MNALLEGRHAPLDVADTDELDEAIDLTTVDDRDLRDLARRCRELLAAKTTEDCPPGHWLG